MNIIKCLLIRIPSSYKTAFIFTFIFTLISFSIFVTQYVFHNHFPRLPWVHFGDQFKEGRWFTPFWFWISNFSDVPVLNPILGTLINVISAFLVISMWENVNSINSLKTYKLVLLGLIITICPVMLPAYYFSWATLLYTGGIFLSVLGLYISSSFSIVRITLGAICIVCGLASYQPCISVISVVFMSIFILRLIESETRNDFFSSDIVPKFFSAFIGVILYRLSLIFFGIGLGNSYQTKTIAFDDMFSRFAEVVYQSFYALIYTQPEFLTSVKLLLLTSNIVTLIVLIYRVFSHSIRRVSINFQLLLILLVSLIGLVVSTKTLFLISSVNTFSTYRLNLSMAFFYAFSFYVLFRYLKLPLAKNILFLISCFVILRFSQADLVRQGLMIRGVQHDIFLTNRILQRIEQLDELDYSKRYLLVRTRNYPSFIDRRMASLAHKYDMQGEDLMRGDYVPSLSSGMIMTMLGSKIKFQTFNRKLRKKIIKQAINIAKKQNRHPWPHSSSVFIYKDWIIVYM